MTKSVSIIGSRGYPSYYGGFETMVRELAPYLIDQGWDVTVYGRPGATKSNDSTRDERVCSKITRGIESKSLSTLSYGLTSTAHSAIHCPDVALVLNVANGYWLPMLKARGIPTLVNVDGIEWERAKWGRNARLAFKLGANLTAKFADELVFDSKAIEEHWGREFARSGLFVPYGAHKQPSFDPVPGFASGKYVLMVARFVPENTVEEFFSAAELISQNWDVVIVGSSGYGGELDDRARTLAAESDRIHWLGHVSDDAKLFALWQHAGAYFHGHSVGGTNPALVQAMACGAPVVARDTVYNREVLGENAKFVRPDKIEIADSISQILADESLQAKLSSAVQKRQRTHYQWRDVCAGYQDALYKLSENEKRSARTRFFE